jgi:hypothetical protein
MNDYISFMANKNKKANTRLYYKKKALNLFVGCGESYEEDGVRKEGVQMDVLFHIMLFYFLYISFTTNAILPFVPFKYPQMAIFLSNRDVATLPLKSSKLLLSITKSLSWLSTLTSLISSLYVWVNLCSTSMRSSSLMLVSVR